MSEIFKVRVRVKDVEASVEIPLGKRTIISMDEDGTAYRAVQIVEQLIEKLKTATDGNRTT